MLGGDAKVTPDQKSNLLRSNCLKAILYVSKSTVVTPELQQKLLATFDEIPLIVFRVDTLPKNAPIELEMIACVDK